jgi:hypothetical protein
MLGRPFQPWPGAVGASWGCQRCEVPAAGAYLRPGTHLPDRRRSADGAWGVSSATGRTSTSGG